MTNIHDLMTGGTVRTITRWGTPVMHQPTTLVTEFGEELHAIVRDMFATMAAAEGVGLAGTQIGLGISLFIYDCPDADNKRNVGAFCNPSYTTPEGRDRHLDMEAEGCLSFPGAFHDLARPDIATCTGLDIWGNPQTITGTGLFARCLQHETDHLNGTVFGDRLSARSRRKLDAEQAKLNDRYPIDWPVTPKSRV